MSVGDVSAIVERITAHGVAVEVRSDGTYVDGEKVPRVTYHEMCERGAEYLKEHHGIDMTADEVWDLSPSGELGHVLDFYHLSLAWRKAQRDRAGG